MKTFQLSIFSTLFLLFAQVSIAQSKTENFTVAGNCGMCKNKIESSAKKAGASYALWNEDTKELTVKYDSSSTNTAKIQQAIAGVGYDTPNYKATDETYEKLHECCKYERTALITKNCCDGASCTKEECKTCCVDGKCTKNMDCCKSGDCAHAVGTSGVNTGDSSCCKKA